MSAQRLLFAKLHPMHEGNGRRRQTLILPKLLEHAASDMRLRGKRHEEAHATLTKWSEMESRGRLRKMKETALEADFLTDVFGNALGYTLFSENAPQWQLRPKFAVPHGEADAAIGFFAPEKSDPPRALIELKGPTVNLDRDRFNGRTPVQQLWEYLNAVPECPWGILTNYVSFRLYHRNKTQYAYEQFTLEDLRDIEVFRRFYVLFERGGLLPLLKGQRPRAELLLEQSEQRQREVGSKLYQDYHANRVALIEHLRSEPHSRSVDEAIHISQKLLDRIIFVAFCEDRELLPPKSIHRAWERVAPFSQVTNPRWQNFRALFRSIDTGHERDGITAYNGGLFAEDPDVDDLDLDDHWTNFFHEISTYDFHDEVNVDVLGHLFEQSITDLESIRDEPPGETARPARRAASGRRRREGVYYTPPYVTRHIVENTVGTCLRERFDALAGEFGIDPGVEPTKPGFARWIKFQQARLDALRGLRVCDPACGSGAFLIQAYDYLENIYDEVVTALCLHQGDDTELYDEISDTILRENLFGVDLSEEAVEITKLALWIRTARPGRSLADLSDNIKCGNSIVDDPSVTPAAFDWRQQFPGVFDEGGFDCVISNPPYVKLQNFRRREPQIAAYLPKRFRSAGTGNFDMYLPFIEQGIDLLREDGRMGYIAPSLWLFNEYGQGLRELVAERRALERFIDFKSFQVFPDATTYTALQFFTRRRQRQIHVADAGSGDLLALDYYSVSYRGRGGGAWALLADRDQKILDHMRERSVTLAEASKQIFQGLITSADSVYHLIKLGPGRYFSEALNHEIEIEDGIMKPLVSGEDAVPFATPPTDKHLLFPYLVTADECRLLTASEMRKRFRRAWAYLEENEEELRAREHGKMDHDRWYGYVYPKNLDKQEQAKLFVPRLLLHLFAGADPRGEIYLDNVDVGGVLVHDDWDLYYILAVLNSKACDYAWRLTAKPFRGEYRSANKQFIAPLPIPKTRQQKPLATIARKLAKLHAQRIDAYARVHRRFVTDLPPAVLLQTSPLPPSLPAKVAAFDEQPRAELLDQLEKLAKRRFKRAERADWDEFLTKQATGIASIKRDIRDLQAELDQRVYKLFKLSAEQIKTIEA